MARTEEQQWAQVGFFAGFDDKPLAPLVSSLAQTIDEEIELLKQRIEHTDAEQKASGDIATAIADDLDSETREWSELLSAAERSQVSLATIEIHGGASWLLEATLSVLLPIAAFIVRARPSGVAATSIPALVTFGSMIVVWRLSERHSIEAQLLALSRAARTQRAILLGTLLAVGSIGFVPNGWEYVGMAFSGAFGGLALACRSVDRNHHRPIVRDLSRKLDHAKRASEAHEKSRDRRREQMQATSLDACTEQTELARKRERLKHHVTLGYELGQSMRKR